MINLVEWDTKHFGIKVGVYDVSHSDKFDANAFNIEVKLGGYDVVYIKSLHRIEQLDVLNVFCNERIVYEQMYNSYNPTLTYSISSLKNAPIRSYKYKEITKELIQLTLDSGLYSRYNLDSRFSKKMFELLYRNWLLNSINTDFAKDVLVYTDKDKPIGLLTYDIHGNTSTIGIIAVNSNYRGQYIGSTLLDYYKFLQPLLVSKLKVVTQGVNHQARFFYEKNGYQIEEISYIYHYWINPIY